MSPMPDEFVTQVDGEVEGEPIQVGAYTLQPLARAQGKIWRSPEGKAKVKLRAFSCNSVPPLFVSPTRMALKAC